MAIKEWTWSNFYNGLSEDRYFWAEKGFFQVNDLIDTQSQPRGIRLMGKRTLETLGSGFNGTVGDCALIQRLEDWFTNYSGWIHVIGNTLYRDGDLVSGMLSSGITGWSAVTRGGNAYVLLFGTSWVDIYNVASGVLTVGAASISGVAGDRPSINMTGDDTTVGIAYVGCWPRVYRIYLTGPTTATSSVILDVRSDDRIVGMTRYNTEYRIYSKSGNSAGTGGRQYIWDGATNAVASVVEWLNLPIRAVVSAGAYDYVLAWVSEEFANIYIATGSDRKLVKTGLAGWRGRRFFPRMAMCKDVLYVLWAIDITKSGETQDRQNCIFSYWSENAGFPKGMQLEATLPNNSETEIAYCNLYPTENKLFYVVGTTATIATKQYYMEKRVILTTDYEATGSIVSNTFTGGVIWAQKEIKQLSIGYSLETELWYGGTIGIYYRKKAFGAFTLLRTISDATINYCKIFENEIVDSTFNTLELKIVLNATANGDYSPFVYEVTTIYEDNLRA